MNVLLRLGEKDKLNLEIHTKFKVVHTSTISRSKYHKTKSILIYIANVFNNDTRSLNLSSGKTVKKLKKEIEILFNLNYSLDEYTLRLKIPSWKTGKIIKEENENKTLFENHFKNESEVFFGRPPRNNF